MKRIILGLLVVLQNQMLAAQSIGIGTTTPNSSSVLDLTSTSKGLLIPRMTSAQRQAIVNPPAGLIVYETNFGRFYMYDGTAWKFFINNDRWTGFTGVTYNIGDNIGINTAVPSEKLEVGGNIKASGEVIGVAGLTTFGNLYTAGTTLLNGAVTVNGNITTHTGVTINDPTGTLQLQNGGVDKGFVQLSGDNLRLGTNSNNITGKLVIRNGGGDRVFVNGSGEMGINVADPLAYLHINSGPSTGTLRLQGDANPTLQFYRGTSSIGSIQVSGDDLRFSAPGNKVILNGLMYVDDATNRVGINTSTPANNLHVQGDMKVSSGKVYNNDGYNMLPIAWAKFSETGTRLAGTPNISAVVKRFSSDDPWFEITVPGVDLHGCVLSVTVSTFGPKFTASAGNSDNAGKASVHIYNIGTEDYDVADFHIIIYK
jgi:hypothetical protein